MNLPQYGFVSIEWSRLHRSLLFNQLYLRSYLNRKNSIQEKIFTQRFQCYPQNSFALINNEENIEKEPHKQDRLENDYSSKQEDAYNGPFGKLYAFYRFTRPYAAIGTGLAVTSVSCLPVETISDFTPTFFIEVLKAVIATILAHIYVVGVNQLYDIEIDKANKKLVPIASGIFSIGTAKAIVWIVTLLSLSMGVMSQSPAFLCGIRACLIYGTVYSVDDVPDVDGDEENSIVTSSTKLGKERAFSLGINILLIAYGLGMIIGVSSSSLLFKLITILGHSAIAAVLSLRSRTVDLKDKLSTQSFYMFIWKLIYAECFLLQFVR
ncbi:homogentisate geranylgeranyltransferase, chloroplastic-like [Macadamia integrifolia]|uniref:homogentisate geranylgeranyltransferase, chloroplastic-like n=1 Tax=Macadamia integrifolia TaxID=60698 RepID=UPI001C4E6C75|nr:homogentisate geranylgeranyltransferase, chloroplastic-like [Macadamia integrifolia]